LQQKRQTALPYFSTTVPIGFFFVVKSGSQVLTSYLEEINTRSVEK